MRRVVIAAAQLALLAVAVLTLAAPAVGASQKLQYPSTQCPQSSTGLNDCIAGASTGATITVKPGVYHESGITIGQKLTINGACGKTIVDAGFANNAFLVGADNVSLSCLTIRHPGDNYDGIYAAGAPNNLHLSKVTFVDASYGLYINGTGSAGLSITNSSFTGIDSYGLYVNSGATGGALTSDTFSNIGSECMDFGGMSNGTISNNKFGPCGSYGVEIDSGDTNMISGNKINGVDSDCIYASGTHTTVTKNTINGCNSDGIYLTGNNATVTFNKIVGQVDGTEIDVNCSDNAVISNNTSTVGSDDAEFIYLCQNSSGTETITNNSEVAGLNDYGVECSTCDNATITGNKILGGGESDAFEVVGANPDVSGNTGSGGWDSEVFYVDCTAACTNASVSKNTASGSNDSDGFDIYSTGCAAFPCMTIAANTSTANLISGFYISAPYSSITGNKASGNGYTYNGCTYSGFKIQSDNTVVSKNTSTNNACDGFYVDGAGNSLTGNTASGNFAMGFQVGAFAANTLDKNTSSNNHGDGFNNDGTNTAFTNDKSSGNRQDCTNDSGEAATVASLLGTSCKDGTNFAVDSTMPW